MSDADMVPRARLNEEIAKRKELEADHVALKAALTTAEAKAAEADALRAQLTTATAEHETFRVGVEAGVTDAEGLELARYFYNKIQPDDTGERPTFGDYMGRLKAEPTARPKALGAYFADAAPVAAPTPAPAAAAPAGRPQAAPLPAPRSAAPLPGTNTGATPAASPAPAQGGWNAAQLAALTPGEYQTHRAELLQQASIGLASVLGSR